MNEKMNSSYNNSLYVIHGRMYVRVLISEKMVIIRLVILVKKDSFRGLSTGIFSCFFPCKPPRILILHYFTMLFMKIFATNINKPYAIRDR